MSPKKPNRRLSAQQERAKKDKEIGEGLELALEGAMHSIEFAVHIGMQSEDIPPSTREIIQYFLSAEKAGRAAMVKNDKPGIKKRMEIIAKDLDSMTLKIFTRFAHEKESEQKVKKIVSLCAETRTLIDGKPDAETIRILDQAAKTNGIQNFGATYDEYENSYPSYRFTRLLEESMRQLM